MPWLSGIMASLGMADRRNCLNDSAPKSSEAVFFSTLGTRKIQASNAPFRPRHILWFWAKSALHGWVQESAKMRWAIDPESDVGFVYLGCQVQSTYFNAADIATSKLDMPLLLQRMRVSRNLNGSEFETGAVMNMVGG
jgi:hypothetical protein